MAFDVTTLLDYVGAIGALGTASMGLVDTFKVLPGGGISRAGLGILKWNLKQFNPVLEKIPDEAAWETLTGLWINGETIENQKAKAKALLKLGFNTESSADMGKATKLDPAALGDLARAFETSTALSGSQTDLYGRLDAILSAVLDGAYEKADQKYRNVTKGTAALLSVLIAVGGRLMLDQGTTAPPTGGYWPDLALAALTGLIATPLAPVTKDLTTAINSAVLASGKLRALIA